MDEKKKEEIRDYLQNARNSLCDACITFDISETARNNNLYSIYGDIEELITRIDIIMSRV